MLLPRQQQHQQPPHPPRHPSGPVQHFDFYDASGLRRQTNSSEGSTACYLHRWPEQYISEEKETDRNRVYTLAHKTPQRQLKIRENGNKRVSESNPTRQRRKTMTQTETDRDRQTHTDSGET